jgi:hypothetical protein
MQNYANIRVNLRQVAPVVNPASQALSSVQVVLILEWIVLSVSTLKLDQPFTSEYLRNFAFSGIMVVSSIITSVVVPAALIPSIARCHGKNGRRF